jgi:flagellar hook-associated protein 2
MSTTSSTSASTNSNYGQSILTSLSAGSGVDVKSLAKNLVDAEKAPQADAINAKIKKSEARISGYGAIKFMLSDLKAKFAALDDLSDFSSLSSSIGQSSAFSADLSSTASAGNHSITVTQLAKGQRSISSSGFSSPSATLSSSLTLNMSLGSTTLTPLSLAAGSTASAMVASINSQWGSAGFSAQLVNKGGAAADSSAPYHLVITGPSGASNSFSVSGLDFEATPINAAQSALLSVDGVAIESSSNTVKDAIPGVTLNLTAPTSGASSLNLTRNLGSVKTKVEELVTAYNDVMSVLTATSDPKSTLDTYGATLVGDSTVSLIRNQVRNLFFGSSSSPGSVITSMRDLGISVDRQGAMTLDSSKLDSALQNHFDDTVEMLSNSRATPTLIRSLASGSAGDAVKKIDDMLSFNATLSTQSANATKQQARYEQDLTRLDDRMSKLLERYNQQFTAMESLVSQINSQKSGLKSTFDAMLNQSN